MLEICALASGSNGNCYYIGNEQEAVLIDGGIYYKHLINRLKEANLDPVKIKAIYVTHEHTDHMMGVKVCSKRMYIPVYFTKKTFRHIPRKEKPDMVGFFEAGSPQFLGNLIIRPFRKMHDAADPCSFRIEFQNKNVGVFTDIGMPDESLKREFSKCDAVFLETNYDLEMLWNGTYPDYLKKRIDSDTGHLSNNQALELAQNYASPSLKYIFLSHISAENNSIERVQEIFSSLNNKYSVIPTSRHGISEVIRI